MVAAISMTFATTTLATAQGQLFRLLVAAIAAAIYFFINRRRRQELLAGIGQDPRLTHDFAGFVADFPPPDTESRWNYGWLWVGIILALIGCYMVLDCEGTPRVIGMVLLSGGGLLAFLDYRLGFSKGEPEEALLRAEFHEDGVCLTYRFLGRTEHAFGPSLALTVECREVTEKSFGADSLQGYGFFLKMQAPAPADAEILMDFAGVGEFLALARHRGSPVLISPESPAWFREKLEALPSWQPGYMGN
jgi:hypothetical protein